MSSRDESAYAAPAGDRGDRRRARTRQKLITAARELLSEPGYGERSISEITEAADVGLGSFYNHFESKDALFTAAVNEVLDEHGALLDATSSDDADPAHSVAIAIRSTARLVLTHPEMAQILATQGMAVLDVDSGLMPRLAKVLRSGIRSGRFVASDPQVLLTAIVGALVAALHLWLKDPELVDDEWCAALTERLLTLCGIDDAEAVALARTL
ncbi:MAG: TetR/AcrR family transcriptional regulator [Cumulibacter sp.]